MQQPPTTEQQQAPAPAPPQDDLLGGAVKIVLWMALWYFFGPAPWRGYALRKRLSQGEIWHARRRWDEHTNVAIALPVLCWAITLYFHRPVAQIWSAIFATLAGWIHLPALVLLGNASIFPPDLSNLLFRWLLCAPLVPLIARTLEERRPETVYTIERVVTDEDRQIHQAIQAEEAAERQAIADAKREERERLKALKAARPPRTSKKPPVAEKEGPHIPHPTSLWGSVDWSKVRDDDPTKQLALVELRKLTPGQLADAQRHLRNTQGSKPPAPAPVTQTPVSPERKQESGEYDWDAGDGSVSF